MVIEQLPLDLTYSASSYRSSPLSSLVCVCSLSSKQDEKILVDTETKEHVELGRGVCWRNYMD